jgi:hypothetical protein
MRKGLRQKPPVDFALLKLVAGKHIALFAMLLALGICFSLVSWLIFRRLTDADSYDRFMMFLIGGVFLCTGLFLIVFAFKSSFSSIRYYYGKGLLKHYGLNLNATLVRKLRTETDIELELERHSRREHIEELELKIWFDFQFDGQRWQCADLINSEKLFEALSEGQTIPVRILPWTPESASVRQRALQNQLRREKAAPEEDDSRIAKPLIDSDEI